VVGYNSNFWVDIFTVFKDDAYPMPPLPTNNNIFIDRKTRQDYHISPCVPKWVTPGKLQKWYSTAHNLPLKFPFVDGFERPLPILPMFETPLLSGLLINTKSKRAQDDNDIQISQLLRSMKGAQMNCPKKRNIIEVEHLLCKWW
jgi:hypothetical protein